MIDVATQNAIDAAVAEAAHSILTTIEEIASPNDGPPNFVPVPEDEDWIAAEIRKACERIAKETQR